MSEQTARTPNPPWPGVRAKVALGFNERDLEETVNRKLVEIEAAGGAYCACQLCGIADSQAEGMYSYVAVLLYREAGDGD